MSAHRLVRILAGGAASLALAGSAAAYVLLSPNRTWNGPPDYIVDNRAGGIPSVLDSDGGATRIVTAVASTVAWNGAGSSQVLYAHKGSISGFSLGDGVPMLNLSDPMAACTGTCLAATFTGFYSERAPGSNSWRITDADMVTNSAGYNWTSQGEDPGGAGCSSEIYAEGVMVHEMGHALGLGHTPVAGATMFASVAYCNNGPATTEPDDENGLVALYGSAPCGGCDDYTEHLTPGATDYQPNGTFYWAPAGLHHGYLRSPAGADFDLYLFRWNGTAWVQVSAATTTSSLKMIHYNGTAGYYLWSAYGDSGSGTYHFWLDRP